MREKPWHDDAPCLFFGTSLRRLKSLQKTGEEEEANRSKGEVRKKERKKSKKWEEKEDEEEEEVT